YCSHHHRNPHSSPTRRSSDLATNSAQIVSTGTGAAAANITITGTSNSTTNYGVNLGANSTTSYQGAQITTADGSITINATIAGRSEEHTSELQSRVDLVCRLL